jgi:serralysin
VELVFDTLLDGNDKVIGSYRSERLTGHGGNDTLEAGAGSDTMLGGAGNDTYCADDLLDDVSEMSATGTDSGGIDTVLSSVNFVLPEYVENLVLSGIASTSMKAYGNVLDNRIEGHVGADFLVGGQATTPCWAAMGLTT